MLLEIFYMFPPNIMQPDPYYKLVKDSIMHDVGGFT